MKPVSYRLRTLGNSLFSQHDVQGGDWAGEPHSDLLKAAQEFIDRKGVGKLRIMREVGGHPRALLNAELRVVNDFISSRTEREAEALKRRRVAA